MGDESVVTACVGSGCADVIPELDQLAIREYDKCFIVFLTFAYRIMRMVFMQARILTLLTPGDFKPDTGNSMDCAYQRSGRG